MKVIPWLKMLGLAVQEYGIMPADFWEMTMKEYLAIIVEDDVQGVSAAELAELLSRFDN